LSIDTVTDQSPFSELERGHSMALFDWVSGNRCAKNTTTTMTGEVGWQGESNQEEE